MIRRRDIVLLPLALGGAALAENKRLNVINGTYDVQRMRAARQLTFPRVLLYDRSGAFIGRESWPEALAALEKSAGEAYCCISDKPPPPGSDEPPPDCKVIVHGQDIDEHFRGLHDGRGKPLTRAHLPPHKYLVVEYFAAWCAPCIPARKALDAFMQSSEADGFLALIVDFTAMQDS